MFIGTYFVKRLFYFNIFISLLTFFTPLGEYLLMGFGLIDFWNPIQLIGYLFLHGNFNHLFGNMIGLIVFGPIVEQYTGAKKFILYYLIMGIVAGISQLLLGSSNAMLIGASGSIFGLITFAFLLNPNMKFLFGIPFKLVFYAIIGFEIFALFGPLDNIGHIAHLFGALTGLLLFIYECGFNPQKWKKLYLF